MKKKRKLPLSKHSGIPLLIVLILMLGILSLIYIAAVFSKPIPDVVEIPKDVQESIKNIKPQKYLRVPILLYHYVEYVKDEGDTIRKSLNIVPFIFDEQIKSLKEAGYTFVTTSDLADDLNGKITLPKKAVALTFDDGYRDFYTDVFPILKKYQVRATVFVVPNFLDRPNNLDTWMLKEIATSDIVEIGAHTMDHAYLQGLSLAAVKYEVEESKKTLEKLTGKKVVSFAYPYGAFDNQAIDVVKKAGFEDAVTTIPGNFSMDVNRFFLYRVRPGGRVGTALLDLVEHQDLAKY